MTPVRSARSSFSDGAVEPPGRHRRKKCRLEGYQRSEAVKAALTAVLVEELVTGIVIGITLGSLACPLVWLGFGSNALAATVAITLVAASSVATTIGLLLLALFARLGCDPALGSGPIGTVVQDVLSLLIQPISWSPPSCSF